VVVVVAVKATVVAVVTVATCTYECMGLLTV
jgi:hypothetical protein